MRRQNRLQTAHFRPVFTGPFADQQALSLRFGVAAIQDGAELPAESPGCFLFGQRQKRGHDWPVSSAALIHEIVQTGNKLILTFFCGFTTEGHQRLFSGFFFCLVGSQCDGSGHTDISRGAQNDIGSDFLDVTVQSKYNTG